MNTEEFKTIGDRDLCAWSMSDSITRIQTRQPAIAKKLEKLDGARMVGYAVTKDYLKLFEVPYTLQWVEQNVIKKLASLHLQN